MRQDETKRSAPPTISAKWLTALVLITGGALWHLSGHGETATMLPPPALDATKSAAGRTQIAVLTGRCLSGACRVCVQHINGVERGTVRLRGG